MSLSDFNLCYSTDRTQPNTKRTQTGPQVQFQGPLKPTQSRPQPHTDWMQSKPRADPKWTQREPRKRTPISEVNP